MSDRIGEVDEKIKNAEINISLLGHTVGELSNCLDNTTTKIIDISKKILVLNDTILGLKKYRRQIIMELMTD